ncbi:tripartite tricarboxylate transporter substrate-binding protein [Dankookia rubra]|uniref:tripartite tricarboxylate transporter substrate-binding protein n=1 Tax=Dankookia rubra TaxID=1442381 RepID=UPI001407A848|nr:tripartite tricarboxylate transporter substrate-binding protein [Dankookia rubra]
MANVPMVLAASQASGIRSLPELIERIRQRSERVSFGTAGNGTTSHLAPGFLLYLTELKATLVTYRGSGPAMNDLPAGVLDTAVGRTLTVIPPHRGGQVTLPSNFDPFAFPQPTGSRSHQGLGMDRKAKRDLFGRLHREHKFGIGTVAGVAAKFGVHRRMVRRQLVVRCHRRATIRNALGRNWTSSPPSSSRC